MRPGVAEAISRDVQAPIRILLKIIPFLRKPRLRELYENPNTHQIIKNNIIDYLKKRS
jgi:hypothetical protein